VAIVQLECPETGKPVDIGDVSPEVALMPTAAVLAVTEIPCPHCGAGHPWSSGHWVRAMNALRDSPEATRILVEGDSASALS
jgi:endogenous inhibitor of DNA gyrase (YacG/DUF329 family)